VAFSPDGTGIATGSADQTAKVWDARTGTLQSELKGRTGYVLSVAFRWARARFTAEFLAVQARPACRTGELRPAARFQGHRIVKLRAGGK
jgi:WD40 repeat protein